MFTDQMQVLVRKTVAHKPEFIREANQALKHQFTQILRDPISEWWPVDNVCLPLTPKVQPTSGVSCC